MNVQKNETSSLYQFNIILQQSKFIQEVKSERPTLKSSGKNLHGSITEKLTRVESNKPPKNGAGAGISKQNYIQRLVTRDHAKWVEEMKHFEIGLFRAHNKHFRYSANSLYIFNYKSKLRKATVWLIEWKMFESFVILSILINSVQMSIFDYTDRNANTYYNQCLGYIETACTIVFTVEAVLRIIGMGFIIHKNSYLRDPWNWFDLFIVIMGWIELIPNIPRLKSLRTIRVLRPLRSAKAIPSMRRLISSLLSSIPRMTSVVFFLVFFLFLFGVLGVQLFKGDLNYRCRFSPEPCANGTWPIDESQQRFCDPTGDYYTCLPGTYCGNPQDYDLTIDFAENDQNDNLAFYGQSNFDNLGDALSTVFQVITLEGWSTLMYSLQDTPAKYMACIYLVILVFLGGFFLLNLFLAVIMETFTRIDKVQEMKVIQEQLNKLEIQTTHTLAATQRKKSVLMKKSSQALQKFQTNNLNNKTSKQEAVQEKLGDSSIITEMEIHDNAFGMSNQKAQSEGEERSQGTSNSPARQKGQSDGGDTERNQTPNSRNEGTQNHTTQQDKTQNDYSGKTLSTEQNITQVEIFETAKYRASSNKVIDCFLKLARSKIFNFLILSAIVLNAICLSLDRYPIPTDEVRIMNILNYIFYAIFLIEMLVRLIAYGPYLYLKDKVNIFDGVIILLSSVDVVFQVMADLDTSFSQQNQSQSVLTAFRTIRFLRIFKVVRSWKSLKTLFRRIGNTLKDISNFSILLFLFIFTFALLGMELYAQRIKFDANGNPIDVVDCDDEYACASTGQSERLNFDNWINAMIFIFVLLVNDNWNNYMYDYVRASSWYTTIFFIMVSFVGNIILLNLFLAILLKDFEQRHSKKAKHETFFKRIITKLGSIFNKAKKCLQSRAKKYSQDAPNVSINVIQGQQQQSQDEEVGQEFELNQDNTSRSLVTKRQETRKEKYPRSDIPNISINIDQSTDKIFVEPHNVNIISIKGEKEDETKKRNLGDDLKARAMQEAQLEFSKFDMQSQNGQTQLHEDLNQSQTAQKNLDFRSSFRSDQGPGELFQKQHSLNQLKHQISIKGKSLWCLSKHSKFRKFLVNTVNSKSFENAMLVIIILSTLLLAFEQPLRDPNDFYNQVLYGFDIAFTIIFSLECLLKILSFGLILNGPKSYLRQPWNILDLFNLLACVITLISIDELRFVKSIRLLRTLRPLKMISNNEGLRIAVLSLINSIKDILSVFVITLFSFSVYSMFGVNFFKGEFYYCDLSYEPNDMVATLQPSTSYSMWDCYNIGGTWINNRENFDNIFNGFVTLFSLSTTEGWTYVMFNGMDSTRINYTGQTNNSMVSSLYFIIFMILGSMFIMNLFVGIVINTFKFEKAKLGLNFLLSETQKEWILVQIKCFKIKPLAKDPEITNSFRKFCFKIQKSKYFDPVMYSFIGINCIFLSIDWYLMPTSLENAFDTVNYCFTGIFTIEALIKIIALKGQYFKEGWNIFDFLTILGSYIQIIVQQFSNAELGASATSLRLFKMGRVLKLLRSLKGLQYIFTTLLNTLTSLINIGVLLFLLYYIYAIIGMSLFATVKVHGAMNTYANFQNFPNAFLTLIRCSTGEGWNDLMASFMNERAGDFDCLDSPSYQDILNNDGQPNGCGNYWGSLFFFITFELFVTYIFLNLFIAVIIQGFSDTTEDQNLRVNEQMLNKFKEIWHSFDPEGTGYISVNDIHHFFEELIETNTNFIRGGEYLIKTGQEIRNFIAELQLPTYQKFKKYNFTDVLLHLSKLIFKIDFDRIALQKQLQMDEEFEQGFSLQHTTSLKSVALRNQDQLQFESFEQLLEDLQKLTKKNKIELFEELRTIKLADEKKKSKLIDQYEGCYYDSRVVIYMPLMIKKLLKFTQAMKEKRIGVSDEKMKEQAQKEIQQLKTNQASPLMQMAKGRRKSIFTALAANSQLGLMLPHPGKAADESQELTILKSQQTKRHSIQPSSYGIDLLTINGINDPREQSLTKRVKEIVESDSEDDESVSETSSKRQKIQYLSVDQTYGIQVRDPLGKARTINSLNAHVQIEDLQAEYEQIIRGKTQNDIKKTLSRSINSQGFKASSLGQQNTIVEESDEGNEDDQSSESNKVPSIKHEELKIQDDEPMLKIQLSLVQQDSGKTNNVEINSSVQLPNTHSLSPDKVTMYRAHGLTTENLQNLYHIEAIQEETSYNETTTFKGLSRRMQSSLQDYNFNLEEQSYYGALSMKRLQSAHHSFNNETNPGAGMTQQLKLLVPRKKYSDGQFLKASRLQDKSQIQSKVIKSTFAPKSSHSQIENSVSNISNDELFNQIKSKKSINSEESVSGESNDNGDEHIDMDKLLSIDDHLEVKRNASEFTPAHVQTKGSANFFYNIPVRESILSQKIRQHHAIQSQLDLNKAIQSKERLYVETSSLTKNDNPHSSEQVNHSILSPNARQGYPSNNSILQVKLTSQNDIQTIDLGHSRRHSSRYQPVWKLGEELEKITDSEGHIDLIEDQKAKETLRQEHRYSEVKHKKLRELLNIDIDSDVISSDLYQDSELKLDTEMQSGQSPLNFQTTIRKRLNTDSTQQKADFTKNKKLSSKTQVTNIPANTNFHANSSSKIQEDDIKSPIQTEESEMEKIDKVPKQIDNNVQQRFWFKMAADISNSMNSSLN